MAPDFTSSRPRGRILCVVSDSHRSADGVRDHASGLSARLCEEGFASDLVVLDWRESGLWRATSSLKDRIANSRAERVVLHHSHFGWSKHGLSLRLAVVVLRLRRDTKLILWLHDPGSVGPRFRHRVMAIVKGFGLRAASCLSYATVVSIGPAQLQWLSPEGRRRVIYCPSTPVVPPTTWQPGKDVIVSIFGSAIGDASTKIEAVVSLATELRGLVPNFKIRSIGAPDGTEDAVERRLAEMGIQYECTGFQNVDGLQRALATSSVIAVVREGVTPRSSSLAAALMCGVPVVGMRGSETGPPLLDAGIDLVRTADWAAFAQRVARIVTDHDYARRLSERNRAVAERWFSWDAVISKLLPSLRS